MHLFSKGPLWRITIEKWIHAGESAIGCIEASRCSALSSSHLRFPLHVDHIGVLW